MIGESRDIKEDTSTINNYGASAMPRSSAIREQSKILCDRKLSSKTRVGVAGTMIRLE